MKKILMTMALCLALTGAMAQRNSDNNKSKKDITTEMVTSLGLSDQQAADLKTLNTKYADVLKGPGMRGGHHRPDGDAPKGTPNDNAQRPELTDAQKKQMEEFKAKRAAYEKELKGILTEAQYQSYLEMKPQKRGHQGKPQE
jgi:hypothetical protein